MLLPLPIKAIIVCFFTCPFCIGQNDVKTAQTEEKPNISKTYYSYNLQYFMPKAFGNNALAKGTKGVGGFNFKLQLGIYKGFFIGANLGAAYLEVTNPEIVGNYKKTTVRNNYLFVGYEFYLSEKFKIGLSAAPYAETTYKNKIFDTPEARQFDTGTFFSVEFYTDYKLSPYIAVFVSYTYRNDTLDIIAPSEIQSQFSSANFHYIGVGVKLCFGQQDLISLLFD